MYRIRKRFRFEAAHQLAGLPDDHPCARMHGHSYRVEVVLESPRLDEIGFVVDFGELRALGRWIDENWDHQCLNQCLPFFVTETNPTAENIARVLWELCADEWPEWPVVEVRVSETKNTWASYRP